MAFVGASCFTAIVSCSMQLYMLTENGKRHGRDVEPSMIVKIILHHTIVFALLLTTMFCWVKDKPWNTNNFSQTCAFYIVQVLLYLNIPIFTEGETVVSFTRMCTLLLMQQFTFMVIFPPPIIHGCIAGYVASVHYFFRTHAFFVMASTEMRLVEHSAAECIICFFKACGFVTVFFFFRPTSVVEHKAEFVDPYAAVRDTNSSIDHQREHSARHYNALLKIVQQQNSRELVNGSDFRNSVGSNSALPLEGV